MSEPLPILRFAWFTYQDPRGDSLPGLGRVWDRFPRFAPDAIDDRDPPRRRFDTVEQGMAELAAEVVPGKRSSTTMYQFAEGKGRDRPILLSVDVTAACDRHRVEVDGGSGAGEREVYPQFPSEYGGSVKPPLLDEAEGWVGGEPWAAFDVEDLSDLPADGDDEIEGPPDTSPTGVRFEMSYSTPGHLVNDILGLVEDLAGWFGWVIVDEQADTDRAAHLDDVRASWTEASAWAHRVAAPPNEPRPGL